MHRKQKQVPPTSEVGGTSQLSIHKYQSAGGVVIDAGGERVLTLLRPGRPGPDGRPEIRLPKGHIEPGESREETARREVAEEAGLPELDILADLGHQTVEFDWGEVHVVRDESYFLMRLPPGAATLPPEKQFERLWLTWENTLDQLSFEAEREWVRRAHQWLTEFRRATPPAARR
jgi:8-oxo-dGTP pyrophosphatase MutT (NUDIX family)